MGVTGKGLVAVVVELELGPVALDLELELGPVALDLVVPGTELVTLPLDPLVVAPSPLVVPSEGFAVPDEPSVGFDSVEVPELDVPEPVVPLLPDGAVTPLHDVISSISARMSARGLKPENNFTKIFPPYIYLGSFLIASFEAAQASLYSL